MQKFMKWIMPIVFLGMCIAIAAVMMATKPIPQTRTPPATVTTVKAARLKKTDFQVVIPSQGIVQARTRSRLIPQVSGEITWISDSFRSGGFFEQDEPLIKIDARDYETARVIARATLAQRTSAYELEKAQHAQAKANWKRLGDGQDASPLTLREPQLAEARALMESALAGLTRAERDLERTTIKAPYAGRILNRSVDVGQSVAPGTSLAEIFATDYVEIRLPLRNEHLDFVTLPEVFTGMQPTPELNHPEVRLTGQYGTRKVTWNGHVVRTQGAYDPRSRELFVIAQVDNPYGKTDGDAPPLKINQFVKADIEGHLLRNVFIIPRSALRQGNTTIIIDNENRIQRRTVKVLWKQGEQVMIREGLSEGELICLTPLLFAADGAKVNPLLQGEPTPSEDQSRLNEPDEKPLVKGRIP